MAGGIKSARCYSLLLLAALGFSGPLRGQAHSFNSEAVCDSGAHLLGCSGHVQRFPGTLGSDPFSSVSLDVSEGRRDPAPPSNPFPPSVSAPDPSVQPSETQGRQVSWKLIVPNFLSDQAHIWTFPVRLAEGRHWEPTLAIVGMTAALVALDPQPAGYFRTHNNFATFNDIFSVTTTERVFLGLPVVWYFAGLVRHDSYAQQTAFFAAESLIDVDLLAGVMRSVDGRLHPRDIPPPPEGDYVNTWFKAKGTYINRGSFPSGHTAGAFAVASIFALRYGRRHRWVPWVAYSLASLTAFSRVSDSAHFPSDVFLGGALAYTISRYVVLRLP